VRIIREPGKSGNVLATIAIGENYLKPFLEYALHTWQMYAERHDLGIIVFDEDLIPRDHPKWKKVNWQKYLISSALSNAGVGATRIASLDTDILINPIAPCIFDAHDPLRVGVVSLRSGLPYPYHELLRRVAHLRHRYFSDDYPLDSGLFASLSQLFEAAGLPPQRDEACSGVFVFDSQVFGQVFTDFFHNYDGTVESPTTGGDQAHFNWLVQSKAWDQWLDYRYQAIWVWEMAWKFPFLYTLDRKDDGLVRRCIEASLSTNYFLHFAGSWYESDMWSQVQVLTDPEVLDRWERFAEYLERPVTGKFVGPVKPTR
jgi:hypothetical protein